MKKFIVTTTINKPTEATLKFCKIAKEKNWTFVLIGDTKTPHDEYKKLENNHVVYLTPEEQDELYPELSKTIGWKSIQRRNIGFVYAYDKEADIVATIDDDNIPYDNWGDDVYVGQEIEVDLYENISSLYFDPISPTNHNDLWHRGYPIEDLPVKNNIEYKGKVKRKVLVQADFWDGDPDIDAICRLSKKPIVKFEKFSPFCSNQLAPFNSQNTFLAREVIPVYTVLPYTGRMDDIWGSYITQFYFPQSVIYNQATVYQDRNIQDLITNLEKEVIGYRHTFDFSQNPNINTPYMPEQTKQFLKIYFNSFK
jgi:predicted nucleotidyltransferase